ncbi:MAG: DUF167 domain-containing protein [Candidatus Brocadiales bacterium]
MPAIELKKTSEGIVIPVRVQPGAKKNSIVGELAGRLKLQVAAPPEKGKANDAVVKLLAKVLGVQRSSVRIVSGGLSRDKKVLVQGISSEKDFLEVLYRK